MARMCAHDESLQGTGLRPAPELLRRQLQTQGQTYGECIGSSWPRLEVSGSWCSASRVLGWSLARLNNAHYIHCESVYSARSTLRDTQSRALVRLRLCYWSLGLFWW